MTVSELIAILQKMPQDYPIEMIDSHCGDPLVIDSVDRFDSTDQFFNKDEDYPAVVIQVNAE